jgi:hypothetical protein
MTYIYILRDPIDRSPKYVGMTTKPWDRFLMHRRRSVTPVSRWIQTLGRDPIFDVCLRTRSKDAARFAEIAVAVGLREMGHELLNGGFATRDALRFQAAGGRLRRTRDVF